MLLLKNKRLGFVGFFIYLCLFQDLVFAEIKSDLDFYKACVTNNEKDIKLYLSTNPSAANKALSPDGYRMFANYLISENKILENERYDVEYEREKWVNSYSTFPIILAAKYNQLTLISILLQFGANIDIQDNNGYTALMWTCENNNARIAEYLFASKANIGVENYSGQKALDLACNMDNRLQMVELLLRYGAANDYRPKLINEKWTPLFFVKDAKVAECLLNYTLFKQSINYQHKYSGQTPLGLAIENGRFDVAKVLLNHGADITIEDYDGKIPLRIAYENKKNYKNNANFLEVFEILQDMTFWKVDTNTTSDLIGKWQLENNTPYGSKVISVFYFSEFLTGYSEMTEYYSDMKQELKDNLVSSIPYYESLGYKVSNDSEKQIFKLHIDYSILSLNQFIRATQIYVNDSHTRLMMIINGNKTIYDKVE